MKLSLVRLLLIAVFYLLFRFVAPTPEGALLTAFVIAYILEPFAIQKI